eukprot:GHVT01025013.1.p2 GENE.GHVT01025013.1~~GHVT01025013.1.p2  ORF type:complete len:147 (+),score=14.51 GHVT01025013.1:1031-1471(+)
MIHNKIPRAAVVGGRNILRQAQIDVVDRSTRHPTPRALPLRTPITCSQVNRLVRKSKFFSFQGGAVVLSRALGCFCGGSIPAKIIWSASAAKGHIPGSGQGGEILLPRLVSETVRADANNFLSAFNKLLRCFRLKAATKSRRLSCP